MTLLDFVRMTRHHLAMILACTIIGVVLGAVYAYTRPPLYQSTALGVVVAGESESVATIAGGASLAQQRAQSYIALIDTTAVHNRIAADPEVMSSETAGAGTLTGQILPSTAMIEVTATGETAEDSEILANAALRALAEEALRLETIHTDQDNGSQSAESVVVRIVPYQLASGPGQRDISIWPMSIGAGLAGGLAIGYLIAFLRRQLDVRVRTRDDVEELTGHGLLGSIPESKELAAFRLGKRQGTDLGMAGEALRQIRTNLRYVNVDQPPGSVVVTSANPGEGKSTLVASLAHIIARSGQRVIVVDADLRRPAQHEILGVDNIVGLAQVLAGTAHLSDCLVTTSDPNLMLLPSGRVPPNPSEMLGSNRMRELIYELKREAFVIIDAPPMLAVTDPGLLAAASDGAILVARVGKTYREQLRLSASLLRQVKADLLGSVLDRTPRKAPGDTAYGAGYTAGKTYYARTPSAVIVDTSVSEIFPPDPQIESDQDYRARRAHQSRAL